MTYNIGRCEICGTGDGIREIGLYRIVKPSGERPLNQEIVGVGVVCEACQRYVDAYLESMLEVLRFNYKNGMFINVR